MTPTPPYQCVKPVVQSSRQDVTSSSRPRVVLGRTVPPRGLGQSLNGVHLFDRLSPSDPVRTRRHDATT
jgi:hypothetical protein